MTEARRAVRSNTEQLRDTLQDEILMGVHAPGDKLDPAALAERFSVSRTPVREALQQLVAHGLVEIVPKKGTFVSQISLQRLVEMFEVMAELEGMCGRLAARRVTVQQLQELESAMLRCEKAAMDGDLTAYYVENERFHSRLYEASQNDYLRDEAEQLHHRLRPYRRIQLRTRNRIATTLQEHRDIYAAIKDGRDDQAECLLKQHVMVQGDRFTDLVATMNRTSRAAG